MLRMVLRCAARRKIRIFAMRSRAFVPVDPSPSRERSEASRHAVPLVAGDKSGASQARFYRRLIGKADERYDRHLAGLKKAPKR